MAMDAKDWFTLASALGIWFRAIVAVFQLFEHRRQRPKE